MASANLFQQYLQPVRSVADYAADLDKREASQLALTGQRRQNEIAALAADQARQTMAQSTRDRNALENLVKTYGADRAGLIQGLRTSGSSALMQQADAMEKSEVDLTKGKASAAKDQADADAKMADIKWKLADRHAQQLALVRTPEDAAAWVDEGVREGSLPAEGRERALAMIQAQGVDGWKQMAEQAAIPVLERFKLEADAAKQAEVVTHNRNTEKTAAGQLAVSQGNLGVSRERLNFDKQQPKGQYDAERGVLVDPRTGEAKPVTMGGKPLSPKAKSGPMSVTLQKELIESDDNIQSSAAAISALKKAKSISDKAYSGYGASVRAKLASNLGGSESADATVEYDNLIGQQALGSLKSIFGGNPTEGERAILLELQASSDKAPTQRNAIIDRAIKAAEVRAKYAQNKAKSIRSGTYLTEGAPIPDQDASPVPDDIQSILNKHGVK